MNCIEGVITTLYPLEDNHNPKVSPFGAKVNNLGYVFVVGSLVGVCRIIYGALEAILGLGYLCICDTSVIKNGLMHIGRGIVEVIPFLTGPLCKLYDAHINYPGNYFDGSIANDSNVERRTAKFISYLACLPVIGSLMGVARLIYGIAKIIFFPIALPFVHHGGDYLIEAFVDVILGLLGAIPVLTGIPMFFMARHNNLVTYGHADLDIRTKLKDLHPQKQWPQELSHFNPEGWDFLFDEFRTFASDFHERHIQHPSLIIDWLEQKVEDLRRKKIAGVDTQEELADLMTLILCRRTNIIFSDLNINSIRSRQEWQKYLAQLTYLRTLLYDKGLLGLVFDNKSFELVNFCARTELTHVESLIQKISNGLNPPALNPPPIEAPEAPEALNPAPARPMTLAVLFSRLVKTVYDEFPEDIRLSLKEDLKNREVSAYLSISRLFIVGIMTPQIEFEECLEPLFNTTFKESPENGEVITVKDAILSLKAEINKLSDQQDDNLKQNLIKTGDDEDFNLEGIPHEEKDSQPEVKIWTTMNGLAHVLMRTTILKDNLQHALD